jgi:cysteine-rich repeat protein
MRLCYADEWYEACNGQSVSYVYPYGDAYSATACNGKDKDPAVDELDPTGTQIDCFSSGYLIEDMSGNLREWTDDYVGDTSGGKAIYRIRGGSYIDGEAGLACSFTTSAYVEDALASHLGFRCCSTCGNGTLDAGETCDPVIDADCNPIFCGPDTCGDSNLDAGEQCDDGNLLPLDGCSPQCQWE